jgi:hypothetical protein
MEAAPSALRLDELLGAALLSNESLPFESILSGYLAATPKDSMPFDLGASFILRELVMMLHFNGEVRFNTGQRRQYVIQDLLCRHPESSATRTDL